jgi:hypothetical protein
MNDARIETRSTLTESRVREAFRRGRAGLGPCRYSLRVRRAREGG